MRPYATDSREAVCRLLALAMIADGHLAPSELKAMQHTRILDRVGADADAFDGVVLALCEDLLARAARQGQAEVELDRQLLDSVLDDVADPLLRMCTLKAMLDIVHADRLIDGRESLLLQRALRKWSAPAQARSLGREG